MKCVIVFVCVFLLCVYVNEGKDFIVGTRANNLLISTEKVKYRGLPLIRRDKDYTYIDPKERIIKVLTYIHYITYFLFTRNEKGSSFSTSSRITY